jgi:tetratricopeptide (TPR) repeat protein
VSAPRIRYHLNVRAALILTAFGLVAAVGLYVLGGYQEDRALRSALAQVRGFHAAGAEEKDPEKRARDNDLALRHVNQYLASRPDDPEGLEIQAQLLAKIDARAAMSVYEHLLRVDSWVDSSKEELIKLEVDPNGPRAKAARRRLQETRRRLAELDIDYSNFYLTQQIARIMPEQTASQLKYHAAELLTDRLLDHPEAEYRVDDAEAHRLRAMALEGQIIPGKITRFVTVTDEEGKTVTDKEGNPKKKETELLDYTINEYRAALKRDPGDLGAALGLARVYREKKKDTPAAREVMKDLLKARPDSVEVRLACHRFYKDIGDDKAAARELKEASNRSPEDLGVILTIAQDAMKGDHQDRVEAREKISKALEGANDEIRSRLLSILGNIESLEQNFKGAISAWEQGLELSGGTDADLTFRLAMIRIEQGDVARAAELVDQFRRLAGDNARLLPWLEALLDERTGKLQRAIERLELVRDNKLNADGSIQEQVCLALGHCYEKQGDLDNAEKTYREAIKLAPGSAALRLSLAQLLLARQPEEAVKVVEQTLASSPDDPTLLVALTTARFQEQIARPSDRRNWASFDATFERAAVAVKRAAASAQLADAASAANSRLDLIHAERLAAGGRLDEAIQSLKQAAAKAPHSTEFATSSADVLLRQGHPDQALKVLEKASAPEAAGDRGILRIARAQILATLNRGREARALLLRDVDKLPAADRADVWRTLVLLCQSHGDRDTTRAAYSEWARQLPDDISPKFALLEMEFAANDEKAIHDRLAELDPGRHQGARNDREDLAWSLARARERLWRRSNVKDKDAQAGATLLAEADAMVAGVELTSTNPVALLLKGQILEEEGKTANAIDFYSRAWSRGSPEAMRRLVDRLTRPDIKSPDWKQKLEQLRQSDSTKELDRIVAMSYFRNHDPSEATRVVEQSFRNPGGAKLWQAEMFELLGDSKKAEGVLRRLVEQEPNRLELWLTLVRHQADHDGARAAAETTEEIKGRFKAERPELLEAQCRSAANDRPGAVKAFDEALRRYPDDPAVLLAAANQFIETGLSDRAEACLRHLLDRNPKERTAARQLAVLLSARPQAWAQALALLGPEGPPNDTAEDLLTRGAVLTRGADAAQRKKGMDLLGALVADLPADNKAAIAARDIMARFLIASGEVARASQVAATSALTGSDPAAISLYAEALLQSGQLDTAEAQIERLARVNAGNTSEANLRARLIQARSLQKLAKPAKTAATLEQAYLARENAPAGEAFGREAFPMLLAMGPDARDVAEQMARRLAQHNPALSWMPAMMVVARGGGDEALTLCRTAAQAAENPGDLHEACRVALEIAVASRVESATVNRANEVIDAALGHNPNADDLLVMKAMLDHLMGLFEEEVRLYRAVLVRQPRNPVVLNNLAWALSEGLKQPSEALEKIGELINLTGRQAENLDTRGVILLRMGRIDLAIKDLEEVVQAEPSGLRFYHLAHAYQKAGRDADFRKALEQVRKSGLTTATIDPAERADFEALMNP